MPATTPDHDNGLLSTSQVDLLLTVGPPSPEVDDGAQRTNMLTRCGSCSSRLTWPTPKADQWASPVACPNCGRWYFCEGRNHTRLELTDQELLSPPEQPTTPESEAPVEFIDRLLQSIGDDRNGEQRAASRHELSLEVIGVPLSREGRSVCEAIPMTLRNMSSGGVGLIAKRTFRSPLLLLDFGPTGRIGTQLLTELRWHDASDDGQLLGCRFLHHPGEGLPFVESASPDPQ